MSTTIADPAKWRGMQMWCDAYSTHIDALAEAFNSGQIRETLVDASKRTASAARQSNAVQDILAAENQRSIENQAKRWSPEDHRVLKAIWSSVRREFLATAWDLGQDIQYCRDAKLPQQMLFWQGEKQAVHVPPPKDALKFTLAQAGLAIKFLRFVEEHSSKFDPAAYTKQMLLKQGINEHNFDQHRDRLAIVNPWKAI